MQHVTALQAHIMYGRLHETTQDTLIRYCKSMTVWQQPSRLHCSAVTTCQCMPMYDAIRLLHAESHSCMPYVTRCVVYILTRLTTHLSYTAKLGQKAIALPCCQHLADWCLWLWCVTESSNISCTAPSRQSRSTSYSLSGQCYGISSDVQY